MKKVVLYLLLFTYSLGVVKPMLPFAMDSVAHAFFYQKHITTVHWKNGKSHAHHEFINESKKDNETKNNALSKKLMPSDEHTFSVIRYKSLILAFICHPSPYNHPHRTAIYIDRNLRPPRLSVA